MGRTRAATAAQAGGSGDSGQRAKWVRLMMLLRLRERFRCWASFRVVLTRKGIDVMYKAYKFTRRGERRGETSVMTKQKLAQTRAGQTRGRRSRTRRHRPPRERWEEARGGRRPQPTMEDPSPDDAGQTTVRRSSRAGRDEGGSRTLWKSAGGCTKFEEIRSSRDPRDHVEDGSEPWSDSLTANPDSA